MSQNYAGLPGIMANRVVAAAAAAAAVDAHSTPNAPTPPPAALNDFYKHQNYFPRRRNAHVSPHRTYHYENTMQIPDAAHFFYGHGAPLPYPARIGTGLIFPTVLITDYSSCEVCDWNWLRRGCEGR